MAAACLIYISTFLVLEKQSLPVSSGQNSALKAANSELYTKEAVSKTFQEGEVLGSKVGGKGPLITVCNFRGI